MTFHRKSDSSLRPLLDAVHRARSRHSNIVRHRDGHLHFCSLRDLGFGNEEKCPFPQHSQVRREFRATSPPHGIEG